MKKLLVLLLMPISMVFAQEVNVYYFSEGATSTSDNIIIDDDIIRYKSDNSYYSTYNSNDVISSINAFNGEKFYIYKTNSSLVSGKEWYILDDNEVKHYFSQNRQYLLSDIIKELGLQNEAIVMLDFHANWGSGSSSNNTTGKVVAKSIKLNNNNLNLEKNQTYQLIASISPKDAYDKTLTWSSSNSNIVAVNKNGFVKGLKNGKATITVKTKNGVKASCVVTVVDRSVHHVNIIYNANGGQMAKTHHKEAVIKNDVIWYKGKKIFHTILWGNNLTSSGLTNYNNPNYINIIRNGYVVPQGIEWNTKKDGTGKSFSQSKIYKASDFCNASKKDCTVNLYVNWKSDKKTVNIRFNLNGGSLVNPHGNGVSSSNGWLIWDGGKTVASIDAKGTLGKSGLANYNNPNLFNIKKNGYIPQAGAEWNTKPDGTGKSFSQSIVYKASDFCNNSTYGCNVNLYVNWKAIQPQAQPAKIDVVLMIGQSNMVGWAARGEDLNRRVKDSRTQNVDLYNDVNNPYDDNILNNYMAINEVRYSIPKNTAWEYRYGSNKFYDLYNNGQYMTSFGESILSPQNNIVSLDYSKGTNMVPYFAIAYTRETGHKLAIVHAALGGRQIECFLPSSDKNYACDQKRYMYENINAKYKAAIKLLLKKGFTIDNSFYVIMQGEANSNKNGYKNYYNNYMRVHNYLRKYLGLKFGAIVYTSHRPDIRKNKNVCQYVDRLHDEQVKLIKNNKDIILASDWGYKRYTEVYTKAFGLPAHSYTIGGKKVDVVDNSIHFTSASLSKIGVDSAINVSKLINNPSMDTSYTGYSKNC